MKVTGGMYLVVDLYLVSRYYRPLKLIKARLRWLVREHRYKSINRVPFLSMGMLCWICVQLFGCSIYTENRLPPTWTTGKDSRYIQEHIIEGVGKASSRARAVKDAYAAIAKAFYIRGIAYDQDIESYTMREMGSDSRSSHVFDATRRGEVATDRVLKNGRIAEIWHERKSGTYFARAIIDLNVVAANLREKIREIDQDIIYHVSESRKGDSFTEGLYSLKHVHKAINKLHLRKTYIADLRIVSPSTLKHNPPHDISELKSELSQLLSKRLLIKVEVTGDDEKIVWSAIVEGLLRKGLPVSTEDHASFHSRPNSINKKREKSTPNLLVKGKVEFWPSLIRDPIFTFVRWCADFVVLEIGTQRVIGAFSRSGKEGHLSFPEAKNRALRTMHPILMTTIGETISSYIYGELKILGNHNPAATCVYRKIQKKFFNEKTLY